MTCPFGFEKQGYLFTNTEWACGAFSFGHLLNLLGIPNQIDETKQKLKTIGGVLELPLNRIVTGWLNGYKYDGGTEQKFISNQIRKIGEEIALNESNEKNAKRYLDKYLDKQIPFISNVDDSEHWMVIAGKHNSKYIVIDSADKPTIDYYSWTELNERWACQCESCFDEDEEGSSGMKWCHKCDGYGVCKICDGQGEMYYGECRSCRGTKKCNVCSGTGWIDYCFECGGTAVIYYGIGLDLTNTNKIGTKTGLKQIKHFIDDIKYDVGLQEFWGFYLKDLKEIFELNLEGADVISASEFFDEFGDQIVEMVDRWIGECDYDIEYELDNYRFVTEFYDFKFHKKDLHQVLIDFTGMFALAMADDEWDVDC